MDAAALSMMMVGVGSSSSDEDRPSPPPSDCGTEFSNDGSSLSVVAARREWLKSFEQRQKPSHPPVRKQQPQKQQQQQQRASTAMVQSRDDDDDDDDLAATTGNNATDAGVSRSSTTRDDITNSTTTNTSGARTTMDKTDPSAQSNTTVNKAPSKFGRTSDCLNRTAPAVPVAAAVKRNTSRPVAVAAAIKSSSTAPLKSYRTMQREQVKATDEGYASVADLSKWLASDPTSAKKKKHVRRGRNVIMKSRQFEKDQENVIIVENSISRGAVKDRQKWLQGAFHHQHNDDDDGASSVASSHHHDRYARTEIAGGTGTFSFNRVRLVEAAAKAASKVGNNNKFCVQDDSQSEIITDDAASSLSVAAKKDWLKSAFSSSSGSGGGNNNNNKGIAGTMKMSSNTNTSSPAKHAFPPRAQTDVMYGRGTSRNEAASRAKLRFKERSARKLLFNSSPQRASIVPSDRTPIPDMEQSCAPIVERGDRLVGGSDRKVVASNRSSRRASTTSTSFNPKFTADTEKAAVNAPSGVEWCDWPAVEGRDADHSLERVVEPSRDAVVEDDTHVDFRAARAAVLQRGKTNGHKMQVVNKVYLRKQKYEKIEEESRRKSSVHGLVQKPSWDLVDPTTGRPNNSYERHFVSDVAPKKSFEDLP